MSEEELLTYVVEREPRARWSFQSDGLASYIRWYFDFATHAYGGTYMVPTRNIRKPEIVQLLDAMLVKATEVINRLEASLSAKSA
jgi:hypothetical protein